MSKRERFISVLDKLSYPVTATKKVAGKAKEKARRKFENATELYNFIKSAGCEWFLATDSFDIVDANDVKLTPEESREVYTADYEDPKRLKESEFDERLLGAFEQ